MKHHKTTDQVPAFSFEHTDRHSYPCLLQFTDAPAGDLRKRVHTADNHPGNAFLNNQVGTGRGLPIVRTRLQTDIQGRFLQ